MSELHTPFRQEHLPAAVILPVPEQEHHTIRVVSRPRIRISQARATLRRMVGRGLRIALPALDATLAIHLAADEQRSAWPDGMTLSGPDGAMDIENGARLLRVLTGIDLELHGEGDGNAEWLSATVLGRLADTPFSIYRRIAGNAAGVLDETEVLRLALCSGKHLVTTHLRADAGTLVRFLSYGQWSQMRQSFAAYESLPIDVSVHIGSHPMSAAQLRSLAAGDIVLPQTTMFNAEGEGRLALGQLHIRVRYVAPGTLSVLDVVRTVNGKDEGNHDDHGTNLHHMRANTTKGDEMEERYDQQDEDLDFAYDDDDDDDAPEMTDADTAPADNSSDDEPPDDDPSAAAGEFDAVCVNVHFVIGKARITLGDMRTLTAGSIILSAGGSPESVSIVSSERTLGRGEVVEVDGRLGVRVTQWGNEGE